MAEFYSAEEFQKKLQEIKADTYNPGDAQLWLEWLTRKNECDYTDRPMTCCGMAEGAKFDRSIPEMFRVERLDEMYGRKWYVGLHRYRSPTEEEIKSRFEHLIRSAKARSRNCMLVSLSSKQIEERKIAQEFGFNCIQEFHNPNSGNVVGLFTKLAYEE